MVALPVRQGRRANNITAAKRFAALSLVTEGRVYDLAHVLDEHVPVFPCRYFRQTLVTTAHHANARGAAEGPAGLGQNNVNWIIEVFTSTTQLGTHLDGLNHLQIGDRGYNGWTTAELADAPAARHRRAPVAGRRRRRGELSGEIGRGVERPDLVPTSPHGPTRP